MSISYAGHGVQTIDSSAAEITNRVSTPPAMKLRWRSARCQKPLPDTARLRRGGTARRHCYRGLDAAHNSLALIRGSITA